MQVGGVAELLGHEHDPGGHDREVAARPGLLLALLDGLEVGLCCSSACVIRCLLSTRAVAATLVLSTPYVWLA